MELRLLATVQANNFKHNSEVETEIFSILTCIHIANNECYQENEDDDR